jgi:hypothetical protein
LLQTKQISPSNSKWNSVARRSSQTGHFAIDPVCDAIRGGMMLVPVHIYSEGRIRIKQACRSQDVKVGVGHGREGNGELKVAVG